MALPHILEGQYLLQSSGSLRSVPQILSPNACESISSVLHNSVLLSTMIECGRGPLFYLPEMQYRHTCTPTNPHVRCLYHIVS
jgi:hypothetical protein